MYDISIGFSNDHEFDIDFAHPRIRKLLAKINSDKAHGPDGIHSKILKNCAVSLAYPLSILFKLAYNTGSIPADWKLANVIPIFKKGSKQHVENYRPISLTSIVMKTFERLIKDALLSHIGDTLDEKQHGFLQHRSCSSNLAIFCDSLSLSLNDNIPVDVIYFDFSKAFDSVNHDLLLNKLKSRFGINGRLLKFIVNYLRGREQRVVINNKHSSLKPVTSGVPQGSILGPILFVAFIDDISDGLSIGTELALYADDTKIWRQIRCPLDNITLQRDIAYLQNWAFENKMNFHPQKCKVLNVSIARSPISSVYNLGNTQLENVSSECDLGVHVTPRLNWSNHHSKILSKARQKLGMMRRTCHFITNSKHRRVLYLALVRSQFEHCSIIWRPVHKTQLEQIESIQKRCLKWILNEESESYSDDFKYVMKCRQANLLPLSKRFDLNDILYFHKVVYNLINLKLPSYLKFFETQSRLRSSHMDSLCLVSSIQPRLTHTNLSQEPNSSRSIFGNSYFYRTHLKWNSLPISLREITSQSTFKVRLIKYLWDTLDIDRSGSDYSLSSDLDDTG